MTCLPVCRSRTLHGSGLPLALLAYSASCQNAALQRAQRTARVAEMVTYSVQTAVAYPV